MDLADASSNENARRFSALPQGLKHTSESNEGRKASNPER
jgi:hypothetical protein